MLINRSFCHPAIWREKSTLSISSSRFLLACLCLSLSVSRSEFCLNCFFLVQLSERAVLPNQLEASARLRSKKCSSWDYISRRLSCWVVWVRRVGAKNPSFPLSLEPIEMSKLFSSDCWFSLSWPSLAWLGLDFWIIQRHRRLLFYL